MAIIGTVREIKDNEYRVGLVPGGAKALAGDNHKVFVEKGAGLGSGISDEEYRAAGAEILPNADDVWARADLLVGAVLIPGAAAPKLVTRQMVSTMKKGAVIVDVAVDQGGCIETTRVTTHSRPTYEVDGVVHYCVANMPGAVPRTSTFALTNVTLPYLRLIANRGLVRALRDDPSLLPGVNTYEGKLTIGPVGEALGIPAADLRTLLPA
jgi:alanine dehydrogenase